MDKGVGGVLGAWPEHESRDELAPRVECEPEPGHPGVCPEAGPNLVQLEVRQVEPAQEVAVQPLGLASCPVTPAGDGGLAMAEDAHGRTDIQPFGQRAEDFTDAGG
jgi:hypothetical protein